MFTWNITTIGTIQMILVKLCAYINKAITNDKVFYYFVDVIEPMLIGNMNEEQYIVYTEILDK